MFNKRKPSGIFLGWWINLFTSIVSGLGTSFYGYGMSVLFKPISAELGLSRAATALATGVGRLQGGIEAPLTGWLSDRFGPRWVVVTGLLIMVAGLVLMYYINAPWSYYVVWGLIIAIGNNFANTIAIDKVLTDWFIKKRGLALGVRFVILGICGVAMLPVVTWLVTSYGWRVTCLVWAGVMLAGVPVLAYFVKQKRPEYYGLLPDGASAGNKTDDDLDTMIGRGIEYAAESEEVEFTLSQAIKTSSYWIITVSWLFYTIVMGAFNIHIVPFLTDMGIEENAAGGMMAMMVFFTIPARFLGGVLADRVRKNRIQYLVAVAFLLQAVGMAFFLARPCLVTVYIFLALYGFGSGAPTPLRLTMGGRFFGRKAFASIQGSSMVFTAPISFLSPVYAGWIYDTTGSYNVAFITFAAMSSLAAALMCLVRPPRPPEKIGDIRKFI